jgi:hypothetical protein
MKLKKNIALSDSGFLFNPSTGDSFSINPIGNFIVRLIQEGKDDAVIIQAVLKEYMTDRDTVEKDLYDFKNMLSASKLTE